MATQLVLHRHGIDTQENNELLVDYAFEHVPHLIMQVPSVWCWVNFANPTSIQSIVQPSSLVSMKYEKKYRSCSFDSISGV